MNQRFKFRAYNGKEFIYSTTNDGKDRLGWFFANCKGMPIQQSTGLTDKNKKEIYEGDKIRIDFSPILTKDGKEIPQKPFFGFIQFDKWTGGFECYGEPVGKFGAGCEIVGNIFE